MRMQSSAKSAEMQTLGFSIVRGRRRIARWALAGCLACVTSITWAQDAPVSVPSHALIGDVDLLQQAWESIHPGLYRYSTPAQVRERFDALKARFGKPTTEADAFLAFSELAATVKCGHTFANPTNQSKQLQRRLFESGSSRFPAEFVWLNGQLLITRDLTTESRLPVGTVIESINGVPTQDVLARLMRIARADGGNDSKRLEQLGVQGTERYEPFDVFLPLYYPEFGKTLRLQALGPDGIRRLLVVEGLTYEQRIAQRHASPDAQFAGWHLDIRGSRIAVLTMPTWAVYDAKWDWSTWVDDAFARLTREQVDVLVIDLRGNEGGSGVGDRLAAHLIARDLPTAEAPRLVRYRAVPAALAPSLDTWDPSFKDWGDDAEPFKGGPFDVTWFRLRGEGNGEDEAKIAPIAPRYTGKVYVLTDASNSSATFEFAQLVKTAGIAKLVGMPTGGNQRGINGGAFFFLRLPGSDIELDLPLIARFPKTRDGGTPPDAGVSPDIVVARSQADVAAHRDPWIAAVELDLARNQMRTSAGP